MNRLTVITLSEIITDNVLQSTWIVIDLSVLVDDNCERAPGLGVVLGGWGVWKGGAGHDDDLILHDNNVHHFIQFTVFTLFTTLTIWFDNVEKFIRKVTIHRQMSKFWWIFRKSAIFRRLFSSLNDDRVRVYKHWGAILLFLLP